MSDIPAPDARLSTSASATSDHGSLAGALDASNDGASAGAQLVSEHVTAAGDLAAGGAVGEGGASGWLSGGLDVVLAQLGSLVVELQATLAAVLPS